MKLKLPNGWLSLMPCLKPLLNDRLGTVWEPIPGRYAIPGGKQASYEQIVEWADRHDVEVRI
jgi:hypothetical protein